MARRNGKARTGLVGVLDVGSSKICCLIARLDSEGAPRVIGAGHQVSAGVRAGVIVDMESAEQAIRNAVHTAEAMAGETLREVVVAATAGGPSSRRLDVDVAIDGQAVADTDLRRVQAQIANSGDTGQVRANGNGHANGTARPDELEVVHAIPLGYTLDGQRVDEPRGMHGERLGAAAHLVSVRAGALRTLRTVVERCHLDIEQIVAPSVAAGLAALVEDEMDLGATVLDMGAGTTDICVFTDGRLVYADQVPIGGSHVTNDIARGLSTPVAHAERLKTLYGSAMPGAHDDVDVVDVPQVGEPDAYAANHVPRSLLNSIIGPRIEETFELVRARLADSGAAPLAGRRLVLVGGASQLSGVRELAALVLDKQVRLGRPLRLRGLADALAGPAFAVPAGLIAFAAEHTGDYGVPTPFLTGEADGLIGRVGSWLREHL
ncbi:MAG: cell division protein FtsA, partial [Alphaproteobacteria bacterium]|nr:cell division protein FtsA [Alphaproteobacteria bacterium]